MTKDYGNQFAERDRRKLGGLLKRSKVVFVSKAALTFTIVVVASNGVVGNNKYRETMGATVWRIDGFIIRTRLKNYVDWCYPECCLSIIIVFATRFHCNN